MPGACARGVCPGRVPGACARGCRESVLFPLPNRLLRLPRPPSKTWLPRGRACAFLFLWNLPASELVFLS